MPCEAPVMVDAGHFWCTGRGAEVSTEELLLTDVGSPLLVGAGVDVYFELAGAIAIEARAVVTRAKGRQATLRFVDLDVESLRALETYTSGGSHSSTRIRRRVLSD